MERVKEKLILFCLLVFLPHKIGAMLETSADCPRKHFVLVHGSCHGAWSWYKIMPRLRSSGHSVTALDLTAAGINPGQAADLRSVTEYHRPLLDFMASLPPQEKVVLVGHSFGGVAISHAMEVFPNKISVAVFVTAFMPGPTLNMSTLNQKLLSSTSSTLLDSHYTFDNGPNNPPTTLTFGPLYLKSKMYQLSPTEDWELATTLVRPSYLLSEDDMARVLVFTSEKYGSVKRVYIMSGKDEAITKDFQEWMIERNPPSKLLETSESDHLVMMSKPRQLSAYLLDIAAGG